MFPSKFVAMMSDYFLITGLSIILKSFPDVRKALIECVDVLSFLLPLSEKNTGIIVLHGLKANPNGMDFKLKRN